MKRTKLLALFLALVVLSAIPAGCTSQTNQTEVNPEEAAAIQLLTDLEGTYRELWPVVLDEEYDSLWLEKSAELVGQENAEMAYQKMAYMVSSDIYGEDAVKAYAENPDSMAYDCSFIGGLELLTFDGKTISGINGDGETLFSHTYHYVGMEDIRGLYEYESDDKDSGEFTYFFLAPDTSDTTYHIEFRYGSDAEALERYDSGDYAYWLAAGISTDYYSKMVEDCISLFCEENLAQ